MSDVEIMIKIPKEVYERFGHEYSEDENLISDYVTEVILIAFAKGVVLPEGHGKLKDADAIIRELSVVSSRPVKSQLYIIKDAPTLIEADKAESEVQNENSN